MRRYKITLRGTHFFGRGEREELEVTCQAPDSRQAVADAVVSVQARQYERGQPVTRWEVTRVERWRG
jgi:hypothetical protein